MGKRLLFFYHLSFPGNPVFFQDAGSGMYQLSMTCVWPILRVLRKEGHLPVSRVYFQQLSNPFMGAMHVTKRSLCGSSFLAAVFSGMPVVSESVRLFFYYLTSLKKRK